MHAKIDILKQEDLEFQSYNSISHTPILHNGNEMGQTESTGWNAPTIDDLNKNTGRDFDRTGVEQTKDEDRARLRPETALGLEITEYDQNRLRKRGIRRMMVIDVREESDSER